MKITQMFKRFLPTGLVEAFELSESKGPVIYTNSRNWIPNRIRRAMGMPEVRPDRRERRFGRIKANIFYYITPPMIITTLIVVVAVSLNIEKLYRYFITGIYLNALIISLAIFAILKAYHNGYLLFLTSAFIRRMETIMNKDEITDKDISGLYRMLEKKAVLVNTKHMALAINNVKEFGHPNFTDTDARLIKSKLGYRVSQKKGEVVFLSGILVMLGLLGTFLGLLKTIDAVGLALGSMSNIGGDTGEIGVEEMSSFISSLAAPLQGMGLAFSSSLFGLSGSLLIGFFTHVAGTPQNEFIENFSRWVDDRILKFDPKKPMAAKTQKPPQDSEIKAWYAGLVFLAAETNRKIGRLVFALSKSVNENMKTTQLLQEMTKDQRAMRSSMESVDKNIGGMRTETQEIAKDQRAIRGSMESVDSNIGKVRTNSEETMRNIGSIYDVVQKMRSNADQVDQIGKELARIIPTFSTKLDNIAPAITQKIDGMTPAISGKLDEIGEHTRGLSHVMIQNLNMAEEGFKFRAQTDHEIRDSLLEISNALQTLNHTQRELSLEIKRLEGTLGLQNNEEASALVLQLNGLLEELDNRNQDIFAEIFGDGGANDIGEDATGQILKKNQGD